MLWVLYFFRVQGPRFIVWSLMWLWMISILKPCCSNLFYDMETPGIQSLQFLWLEKIILENFTHKSPVLHRRANILNKKIVINIKRISFILKNINIGKLMWHFPVSKLVCHNVVVISNGGKMCVISPVIMFVFWFMFLYLWFDIYDFRTL